MNFPMWIVGVAQGSIVPSLMAGYVRQSDTDPQFTQSDDNGATWSSAIEISGSTVTKRLNPHAVGENVRLFAFGNVLVYRSTDSGATWALTQGSIEPTVGISIHGIGQTIIVAWASTTALKFIKSTNGGLTWGSASTIHTTNVNGALELFVVDDQTYIIAYGINTPQIRLAKTTDGGSSWATTGVISSSHSGSGLSIYALLSTEYAITYGSSDLKLIKSTDSGSSWGTPVNIASSVNPTGVSLFATDKDTLHIAYENSANHNLYHVKSTDAGVNWSSPTTIHAQALYRDLHMTMTALSTSDIFIFYTNQIDNNGNECIVKVATSADGGSSWATRTIVASGALAGTGACPVGGTGRRVRG